MKKSYSLFKNILIFFSVISLILSFNANCSLKKQKHDLCFKDYSFVKRIGIDSISCEDKSALCFITNLSDSNYQEIFLKDSSKNNLKKIDVYKRGKIFIYHFLFGEYFPGATTDLFLAYTDSSIKEYRFDQQMEDRNGPIVSYYSFYSFNKATSYSFLTTRKDTVDFINKLWDFNENFLINKTPSIYVKKNNVFTLRDWLDKHK
jgi:hypothetical protein